VSKLQCGCWLSSRPKCLPIIHLEQGFCHCLVIISNLNGHFRVVVVVVVGLPTNTQSHTHTQTDGHSFWRRHFVVHSHFRYVKVETTPRNQIN
jgi:hypothetical protein